MSYSTEEQATTRVCPQTISRGSGNCVGVKCMAWRWRVVSIEKATGNVVENIGSRFLAGAKVDEFQPAWANVGYCGLAGKPE